MSKYMGVLKPMSARASLVETGDKRTDENPANITNRLVSSNAEEARIQDH